MCGMAGHCMAMKQRPGKCKQPLYRVLRLWGRGAVEHGGRGKGETLHHAGVGGGSSLNDFSSPCRPSTGS